MNIPESVILSGKAAVQALWSDTATIVREVDVNQTTESQTVYENIACHLSQSSEPILNTDNAAAMTELEFTLEVDTEVEIKEGDKVTVEHNGQTFTGLAGLPFRRTFCNSVKLSGVEVA
jgi:hypothetical protein